MDTVADADAFRRLQELANEADADAPDDFLTAGEWAKRFDLHKDSAFRRLKAWADKGLPIEMKQYRSKANGRKTLHFRIDPKMWDATG